MANAIRCACLNLPNANWTEYNEAWDMFAASNTQLSLSYANLYMVASADTQLAADAVSAIFERVAQKEMIASDNEMRDDNGGDGSRRAKYYDKLDLVPDLLRSFIRSAKNDIAVYGS